MPRLLTIFLLSFFLKAEPGTPPFQVRQAMPAGNPAAQGEWLARHVDDRATGRDARLVFTMRLYDRQDRVRERALTVISRRRDAGDQSLTRFTAPPDIAGTGFLVWEHPGAADDERFLFLPSLGRVRRIAGSEAQESFVGSDFTYEDIGGREFEDYAYKLIGDAPGGAAWQLESTARDPKARFPRVVSTVRKDNFVVVHAEIFNRRGEVQKIYDAPRVEQTGKYWTVMAMTMTDLGQKTRTELVVEKAEYDLGLGDALFTRRELEKVIR
jgi:hypothetical protein